MRWSREEEAEAEEKDQEVGREGEREGGNQVHPSLGSLGCQGI